MKNLKKRLSTLLALLLTIVMIFPATAKAATEYALTINGDANHTYKIYQLATADISGSSAPYTVANIALGQNAKSDTTVAKIEALSGETDAEKIGSGATALVDLTSTAYKTVTFGAAAEDGTVAAQSIDVPGGYYVIVDTASDGSIISRNMVAVAGPTTVNPKKTDVTSDKVIDENENKKIDRDEDGNLDGDVIVNTANIGDKVPYVVESAVPDMTGYTKYYFVMKDTLSKGLTYNNDMKVYIDKNKDGVITDDEAVAFDELEAVTDPKTGETTIQVAITDFVQYKKYTGAKIEFVYSATVNKDAELGDNANINKAHIDFSNNPNTTPDGKDDHEDFPKDVTGIGSTKDKETKTYTTGVKLLKIEKDKPDTKLEGAVFQISGNGTKTTCYKEYEVVFEPDDEGEYYLLKDGTYTPEVPTDDSTDGEGKVQHGTADKYVTDTEGEYKRYNKISRVTNSTTTEATTITATATTNAEGLITITGLDAGTYTFTELKAPEGYNLLTSPITVTITFDDTKTTKFQATVDSSTDAVQTDPNGYINFTVENTSGLTLPETGGIGTTIFYVVGGIMMVGAAVLLVTKRRMAR